jgi:broad specificity phosphatase PhoE
MTKLYFVRHGQTISNVENLVQGWSNTELTNLGIQQGKMLGKVLSSIAFSKIYCSTSKRARITAKLINEYQGTSIISTQGLKEMNFGQMELQKEPKDMDWQTILCHDWSTIGGNNLEILSYQMKNCIDDIVRVESGNILCVTHCFSILAFINSFNSEFFQTCLINDDKVDNCTVTIINYKNGKYQIETFNDPL